MLVERFYPDEYLDSTYSIDFAELAKKGYRGVLFDIDNTLVPHGAPADQKAKALFAHLRELGMDYCLISNNQLPRVKPFADAIGGKYIEDAHKPSTKNYRKAMQMMGCTEKDSLFVGDQLPVTLLSANFHNGKLRCLLFCLRGITRIGHQHFLIGRYIKITGRTAKTT